MATSNPASPTYRIFRDKHGIPQFEPKRGTQALKDALIYSFPTLETELQLMQAALRNFFDSERGSTFVFELPESDLQTSLAKKKDVPVSPVQPGKAGLRNWKVSRASRTPSRPSSRASSRAPSRASSRAETPTQFQDLMVPVNGGGTMTTWMLSNGQELEKRKRQPYNSVKRRKVAENRGNACEKHRASKTACDPHECPQNKLYSKVAEGSRKESVSSLSELPESSLQSLPSKKAVLSCLSEHTNTPNLAAYDPTQMEDAASEFETDVFLNPSTMESDSQTSLMDFDYPSTNSHSSTWMDSMHSSDTSWNSCNIYPPIEEANAELSMAENMEAVVAEVPVFGNEAYSNDHFTPGVHQPLPTIPVEVSNQLPAPSFAEPMDPATLWPPFDPAEVPVPGSEDPFMGWASKRASHLFDDYGWVLSHVEAL